MQKKRNYIIGIAVLFLLIIAGVLFYIKSAAPPGEEWISYHNRELTDSIDRQLSGLDIGRIMADKEAAVVEKSVAQLQLAVDQAELTYEEITAVCLSRIKALDQSKHGYNSVMEIAPDAMEQARARDRERSHYEGDVPSLFGIPVMLKDNINTAGIPTSVGTVAFADFIPEEDAELVTALRVQGAVILGKNNLAEFAYFVSSVMPNGYSSKKGQTVNPFAPLKISPSGSSSGSAVAVSVNLVPISIGTETAGSIAGPASANSVVGFKPSRDSVPREGIFPLIQEVDTPGPLAKTVQDAALAYSALSGQEMQSELNAKSLAGAVIGLAVYTYDDETLRQSLKERLEESGARVIEVSISGEGVQVQNIIELTFKQDFELFARQYGLPVNRLEDLIAFNREDIKRRARYGQDLLEAAEAVETPDREPIQASIENAQTALEGLFLENGLDALVFLGTAGSTEVSAAGYPQLTIPFGVDAKGVPRGVTFAARDGEDVKLLNIGYAFEQAAKGRVIPR
ncbi:amidase family protein [Clostridium transplantifaecale]|uniref:amidase family protein n=1 Tax=Clostridium transplantifaecale TaxID=2479838 RepID=UPI000F63BB3B|nr:amidase family protein [Clostridium transplantifaecale]